MNISPALQTFFEPWTMLLAEDPLLRSLQILMLFGGVIAVFLVFYTTRDILLRSSSFLYMFFSILFVAVLPIVGFFLYLLLRPARTLKERELEKMVRSLVHAKKSEPQPKVTEKKKAPVSKKPKSTKKKKDKKESA